MVTLRERVQAGERLFGSFVFLPSASTVEILGRAGLDFVIIDREHSPAGWETVENMVRAADLCGMSALIRVAHNSDNEILHALEVGAAGIVIPFVETADAVRRAAGSLRYAPEGTRGTCTQTRAAGYSAHRAGFVDLARRLNSELLLAGLIENRTGMENITEIMAVDPGLDVVIIGRSDLASDLGRPGQTGDPLVVAATERIISAVQRAPGGMRQSGVAIYSAAEAEQWAAQGCRFFAYPSEAGMLYEAASALKRDVAARWGSSITN